MSRFSELSAKLAAKGAHDPDALAAYIGRKKYTRPVFDKMAAAGRKKKMGDGRSDLMVLRARPFDGRSYTLTDCTVRSDGDGRTVEAYAAAFNVPAEVKDQDGHYQEIILPGAFDKTIAERGTRLTVLYNHGRTLYGTPDGTLSVPVGVPIEQPRADQHGVFTVTRYLNNPLADSVLDAIKQGAIRGQSFTGRFIQSKRVRSSMAGGLPTIHRSEVAWTEYGPTPVPYYQQAHIVGTRSTESWMADLLSMDADERAELFRSMTALATPLGVTTTAEPVREVVTVTSNRATTTPPGPAATANATPPGAGTAAEPHPHSPRQADIARRIRAALITRTELTDVSP